MNLLEMSTIPDIGAYHFLMREPETFGEWLRFEIDRRELTQQQFARLIDVSQTTVSSWINDVQPPTKRNCRRIADALGVERDVVYQYAGREPAPRQPLVQVPTDQSTEEPLTGSQLLTQDVLQQHLSRIERGLGEIAAAMRRAGMIPVDIDLSDDWIGVPVVGRVPADSLRWTAMEEEFDVEMLRADVGHARAPFGLIATGNCLKSIGIYSGDIIICDRAEGREPQDRQLVVVRVGTEVTLKRWCVGSEGVELRDGDEEVVYRINAGDDIEIIGFYLTYKPVAPR